jgi:superoxide reductase
MTERNQVYKCKVCGNIVGVLHSGAGELVCCGKPMVLQVENTVDASVEKHVPVVEVIPEGIRVTVGSVAHPMVEEHYIEWIEVITPDRVYRKYLNPGEPPQAEFKVSPEGIKVREYCNLHGLWKA